MPERRQAGSGAAASQLPTRFAQNALSNYALTAVLVLVALITTPILTHHLGTERFGIWIFVGSAITYVQLLDLGFGGAVVSAVARLSAKGDEDGLERTLNSSFFLLAALGLVALGACWLGAMFLPHAIHLKGTLAGTARDLLLLLGLDVALSIPMDTFGCGLVALQRFDLLNATLIGVATAQAIAWTVVLVSGGGLLLLGIVTVAISLMGQGVRYVMLRRLIPTLRFSPSKVEGALVRSLASPAGWYALGDSLDNFRDEASVLILSLVQNVASAGVFAVGEKLATLGTQMGVPVTEPFFPHAAALVGRGDRAKLGEAARTGSRVSAGVTIPFCLIVALFARPALVAWVGPTYARAAPAVVILALAFALQSFSAAPTKLLSGSGGQRLIASLGLAKVGAQIVLTAILGLEFGVTGVACAVLASVVGVEVAVTLPLVSKRLGTRALHVVLPVVRTHLPALVASGIFGWFVLHAPVLRFVTTHDRVAGMALVGAAGLGVLGLYLVVFVMTGLDRRSRRHMVTRVLAARSGGLSTLFAAAASSTVEDAHIDSEIRIDADVPIDSARIPGRETIAGLPQSADEHLRMVCGGTRQSR
jgi:O-antigen/teichoic acid export membrane protein